MKKNYFNYIILFGGFLASVIFYISIVGLETEKFNNQIKDKVNQINNNLEIELKKIKITLDPFNFKINAKTIGTNILYKKKKLELEYIESEISLISIIRNKFVSSSLEFSTKSILLRDLVTFIRTITDKPELFVLETAIKKGQLIADIKLNFDENGKIKQDYKINGILKEGKIRLLKDNNFEKINFIFEIEDNILNAKDINFKTNKINFFSKKLKISKNKKDIYFEGEIQNKDSDLSNELLKLLNFNYNNLNILNANFNSKSNFSFNINDKFKIKNLFLKSEIQINNSSYKKSHILNDYFHGISDLIYIKDHKIKTKYEKSFFFLEGFGKIKFEKEFDEIKYKITNKKNDFKVISNIKINKLKLKNQKFLNPFLPKLNQFINLKNQRIEINYDKKSLTIKGLGKIQLEKKFDDIKYHISKKNNKFNFNTSIDLSETSLNIEFLNFENNKDLNTRLNIKGVYETDNDLNLNEVSIIENKNRIILKNFLLDEYNRIIKFDKIDLDYFDTQNKRNQLIILRKQKNDYDLTGSVLNANKIITNLLKSKKTKEVKIFKNDLNINLNLLEVFINDKDLINNLKGKLNIKNNKVYMANISALFDKNENLTFTINTNNTGEKITTLFSSRAKPIVKRYKFIKGYEEGYLDFYSLKKNNVSSSKLKIYDFKLQQLPILTKLLTLASLQGIADILSGEGIRFDEFEMNFNNKDNLMKIDEIYAIGPAISILMSGYVEEGNLISLRGTLVPATTINKTIGSIPVLGKILVGNKTGEGVFGVSFKIKGPPKKLETTVNPIKTLTPRFVTRTLEKIKKN